MADVLNIATSGLLSMQKALATTGHNIANVSTEGYSRQTVTFESRVAGGGSGGLWAVACKRLTLSAPMTRF